MEVILNVAKRPITPTSHTNMWQLDLQWTHGDADGESHETIMYGPEDLQKLKYFLAIYDSISKYDYLEDQATAWLKENTDLSDDDIEDLATEFGDDFYDGDSTADCSFGAAFAGATLTYWDQNGKQFEVEWSVKK